MGIVVTPLSAGTLCDGAAWSVSDVDVLASQIAMVAVGQAEHVAEILIAAGAPKIYADAFARSEAIKLVTADANNPYHRDGWIFQVMSWISAHLQSNSPIIRAPHMILAHKGFDGLQIEIEGEGVGAVIIFEDKATENPRKVIREEVWPEFRGLEAGAHQNVLVAEVVTLLRGNGYADARKVVKSIVWGRAKSFKASITVGKYHSTPNGLLKLFAEYDGVAPGDKRRRRGDIFYVENLRPWMNDLAGRVVDILKGGVANV